MSTKENQYYFKHMKRALKLAHKAYIENQWPVGCVIAKGNKVIATARNTMEANDDPMAHAEIVAIRRAWKAAKRYKKGESKYMEDYQLYVTLEPCPMCLSVLKAYRIGRIIYGASTNFVQFGGVELLDCVYEEASRRLLKLFGQKLREKDGLK